VPPVRSCHSSAHVATAQDFDLVKQRNSTMKSLLLATLGLAISIAHADEPTGPQLFATHCASCHGDDGEGGGPVAAVMAITVPNLRTLSMRNDGTFPTDAVAAYIDGRQQRAAHGSRTMPIWGDVLQEKATDGADTVRWRIAAIVEFIERLQYR
jgi:mono/diheme cytochrome c family protein